MTLTERKHWQNGHQVRGGYFHTLALSLPLFPYALMFSWGDLPGYQQNSLTAHFYKLV